MINNLKMLFRGVAGLLLLCGAGSLQAAVVTYNYVITGDVYVGDEIDTNAFNLTVGDTITAYGMFTADLSIGGDVDVSFGSGSGNTMTIDLNGTLLYAADDDRYGAGSKPSLTFNAMVLNDFDYYNNDPPKFNSNFLYFDDLSTSSLFGEWTSVSLTAVPVPAAVWLFSSGLIGLAGCARRKFL